jgi:hypothetical protein
LSFLDGISACYVAYVPTSHSNGYVTLGWRLRERIAGFAVGGRDIEKQPVASAKNPPLRECGAR